MAAIWLRVRVWIGRHRRRLALTAVLIGVAGGLAMGIVAGARRTDSAPARYTERAGGDPDLAITQLSGPPLDRAVAALPGVVSMKAIVFVPSFLVAPTDGSFLLNPNSFAGDDDVLGSRIVEGRFTDPANPNEFTVNHVYASTLAEQFGTEVGDQFQVVSYDQSQVASNFDTADAPAVPAFTATLVGVTESPTEFDDPSPQMVFSRSFLDAHPDVGVVQTIMAVHLDPATSPQDVMDAVRQLPNGADAFGVPTRVVSDSARRAVSFQVTALWLVSGLSVLAAAVLIGQLASRTWRVSDDERRSMLAIGWRDSDLALERAVEAGAAAVVAAPVAIAVAYAITAMFPLGVLRSFEPDTGPRMDWLVAVLGATAIAVVVTATVTVGTLRRTRAAAARDDVGGVTGQVAARGAGMPLSLGARFASSGASGRRSWRSLLAGSVAVAGLVGSLVVGLTLTEIVDSPARWGINYDQLYGNPYTAADRDLVAPFVASSDVIAATGVNIGSLTINGSDTATLAFEAAKGDLLPTVLRGRAPLDDDEVALGSEVARRLHVAVGDSVEVAGTSGEARSATVVGIVVTPDSAGNGAATTFSAYRALNPGATKNVVLVDFRPGVPDSVVEAAGETNFSPPGALVKPTSVRALERVTTAPYLLGAVLTVLLLVGCGYLLAASVRARRRDLAILRALGSDSRQLRAVVHWQASLVAAAIMAVGVPLGIVAGRGVVRLLTDALGIVPGADAPVLVLGGLVGLALLVANALALVPARRATQVRTARLSLDR